MKYILLFVLGVSQVLAAPNMADTLECLKCRKHDELTISQCISNAEFETCSSHKPTCMSELWNKQGEIVFSSECQNSQACAQEEENESKHNQCDKHPIHVESKCRYCCNIMEDLAPGGYCRVPAWKTCTAKGDPHYTTFDGYKYDFSGSCGYIMLEDITSGASSESYRVSATNMYVGQSARVVDVNITVEGYAIEIDSMIGADESTVQIRIDGITPVIDKFPFVLNEGKLSIDNVKGGYMVVSAPMAGLMVFWNKKYHLEIMLDTTLIMEGKVHIGGMCGNANNDPSFQDELKTRGSVSVLDESVESIRTFAESWEVTGSCTSM